MDSMKNNSKLLNPPFISVGLRVVNLKLANREWDKEFFTTLLGEEVAKEIFQISCSRMVPTDVRIWHYTWNEEFIVKSGYHIARCRGVREGTSEIGINNKWWRLLWGLKIPQRLKPFSGRSVIIGSR